MFLRTSVHSKYRPPGTDPAHWLGIAGRFYSTELLFFFLAAAGFTWFTTNSFRGGLWRVPADWLDRRLGGVPVLTLGWISFNSLEFQGIDDMLPLLPLVAFWVGWISYRLVPRTSRSVGLLSLSKHGAAVASIWLLAAAGYTYADVLLYRPADTLAREQAIVRRDVDRKTGDRQSATAARPNIVLIVIDTLRADRLGAYGGPAHSSPELDAFSQDGVRFERVVAPSSWTRPSIGSLLTSLHPRTLGIYDLRRDVLADRFVTMPEILRRNGYKTVGATANPNLNASFNFHRGFDHYVDSNVLWNWMPEGEATKYRRDKAMPAARELFEGLMEKVDQAGTGPFYLQAVIMEVHEAFVLRRDGGGISRIDEPLQEAAYMRAVRLASREVDRFIRQLSARPGWRDTLFVITSDHGQGLSDHPHVERSRGHGRLLYESQIQVPLILYHPAGGLPAGAVVEQPVRLLDLAPTLLAYVGIPALEVMQGASLLPLLEESGKVDLPRIFVVETQYDGVDKIGIYSRDWKYFENRVHHLGLSPTALHRMGTVEDGERTNVASRHPAVARTLSAQLEEWELAHPKADPTVSKYGPSTREIELLRELGYGD